MQQVEPQKRPHYPPTERLAILELRAARDDAGGSAPSPVRDRSPRRQDDHRQEAERPLACGSDHRAHGPRVLDPVAALRSPWQALYFSWGPRNSDQRSVSPWPLALVVRHGHDDSRRGCVP
jgi:hypothetical protein